MTILLGQLGRVENMSGHVQTCPIMSKQCLVYT